MSERLVSAAKPEKARLTNTGDVFIKDIANNNRPMENYYIFLAAK